MCSPSHSDNLLPGLKSFASSFHFFTNNGNVELDKTVVSWKLVSGRVQQLRIF